MDVRAMVRHFILEDLLFSGDGSSLSDDTSLTDAGILDSTGMIELVTFLETKLGIAVADEALVPENLDSVERVIAFVQRKSAAAAG